LLSRPYDQIGVFMLSCYRRQLRVIVL